MQPLSTHTVPGGHWAPLLRGTHAPSTQTTLGPPQSLVMVQGFAGSVQTPRFTSQAYTLGQSALIEQPGVHLPLAHLFPGGHCVWSEH